MNKCCKGCGAKLQDTDKEATGYVNNLNLDFCRRCFRISNYNESKELSLNYSNEDIIKVINQKSKFTLFLVDFITLNEEQISVFKKLKEPKILVVNKSDLIPRSIKEEKIIAFIKNTYQILNKVVLISTLKKKNIAIIKNYLQKSPGSYITGFTNAGKSSLINSLIEKFGSGKSLITASNMLNTTVEFIKIKLDETFFYDCPGFNLNNSNCFLNDSNNLKLINGKKMIKPITLQVKQNENINIHNEIYFSNDKNNSLTFYISNDFIIKKDYTSIEKKYFINVKDNSDLIIKGLGFINIKKSCTIEFSKEIELEVRASIFE